MKKLILSVLFSSSLLLNGILQAQSATATYTQGTGTAGGADLPQPATADLLKTHAAVTAFSSTETTYFKNESTAGIATLTDGVNYGGKTLTYLAGIATNASITYTFNNGDAFDIAKIDIYTSWGTNSRINPNVTVSYSTDGTNFSSLGTFTFTSTSASRWTKTSLALTSVTGVKALKFDFPTQQNSYVGYSEIDVFGAASIAGAGVSQTTTYSEGTGAATVGTSNLLTSNSTLTVNASGTQGNFTSDGATGTSALINNAVPNATISGNAAISNNSSLTYTLNNSATGYDLSNIDIYTAWKDAGRINPFVVVSYSLVATPTVFATLGVAKFARSGTSRWTKSAMAVSGLSGVAALRFDFPYPQQADYVGYSELYVSGSATSSGTTPTISTTGTLLAVSTTYGTASASPSSFSISGADMETGISVNPPAGFQVSTTSDFSSNVGTYGSPITVGSSGTIASTLVYVRLLATAGVAGSPYSGNIALTSSNASAINVATASSTVTAKALTISNIGIANKEYDGTTTATISGTAAYDGLVNGESFSVTGTPSAAFADATVGNSKSVTVSGFTPPSANYSITQPTGLTANITAASVPLNPGTGNTVSATSYTVEELANSNIVVSSGEFVVNRATVNVQSITIAPGAKLTLGANSLTASTPNGIVLESDENGTATLTGDNAVSNAVVQQYVTAGRNWYVSPSVSAAGYTTLSRGTSVVEWNEASKAWDTISSGTLVAGRGYIQVATSTPLVTGTTGTVNFTGTTNAGDVTTPSLTRTGSVATSGFNLVGNPYPSYLRWSGTNSVITDANNSAIGTSFWYRTKNNADAYIFVTHNGTSGYTIPADQTPNTTITGVIPPMQAFWVRVTGTTTMKFTNVMRLHADNAENKLKAPKNDERQRLRLQLANGTDTDEALIYFDAAAANSFDNYDSPKMLNNSTTVPDLYSKADNEKLVINGLTEVTDNMTLPLGFTLKAAATGLTLKVSELSNFAVGTKVYLVDSDQNTQTELLPETQYTFNTTAATTNNESRFSILFRAPNAPNASPEVEKIKVQVYVNAAKQITIIAPEKCNYAIYNAVGMLLENGQTTAKLQTVNCKLNTGVYIVKVANLSTRVIIK